HEIPVVLGLELEHDGGQVGGRALPVVEMPPEGHGRPVGALASQGLPDSFASRHEFVGPSRPSLCACKSLWTGGKIAMVHGSGTPHKPAQAAPEPRPAGGNPLQFLRVRTVPSVSLRLFWMLVVALSLLTS